MLIMLIMFAIAILPDMVRENKGVAAFASFIGFIVFNLGINFYLTTTGILPMAESTILKTNNIQNILGIQSIDTGILGAVIVGIIVYLLHEHCNTIRLPDALAFLDGVRFVSIITTLILAITLFSDLISSDLISKHQDVKLIIITK